ncbi:MAG TPA: alpha/beta hydrolase-fold protein, partial [Saprospiraceae bacterium]|nr:alpha/beta hydrolase-fold protein [Saprospiraceae bacterium]
PPGAALFLAGNINDWQPNDERFRFQPNGDGSYGLVFQADLDTLEYKITRGDWSAAEGDAAGRELPNRIFKPGAPENELWMRVESWTDLYRKGQGFTLPENLLLLHPDFFMPQLGRSRRIWACLPPDYWANPKQRYPVVYMQDGQNLFDNPGAMFGSWSIDKAMNRLFLNDRQPLAVSRQPIVIGIENGGEHRIAEYSPWQNARHGGGEGAQYLDFVCDTLKPFVDEHLRTLPGREYTGIIGSSMGGLLSLYAAIEKPDVFGRAGVFSPALWFSKEIFQMVKNRKPVFPVKILLMAGQQESRNMVGDLLDLYETLLETGHAEENLHYDLHSDGVHSEWFWAREFEHALHWLFGETPGHENGGVSDELIKFRVDKESKELIINIAPKINEPRLEIRDYCHNRQFHHTLGHSDNRISYAEWENCIYSLRLHSMGDLVFSRRVALENSASN